VPEQFHDIMRWVVKELPPEHMSELATWPPTLRLEIVGLGDVVFCHATPRDDTEIFTRITPEDRLRPIFEVTNADLVVCGHTHMQFDRKIGRIRVVNAGSLGMPFGNPGAYWLLLGSGLELRRTLYDFAAATGRIAATDYPQPSQFDLAHPPVEQQMLDVFESVALR